MCDCSLNRHKFNSVKLLIIIIIIIMSWETVRFLTVCEVTHQTWGTFCGFVCSMVQKIRPETKDTPVWTLYGWPLCAREQNSSAPAKCKMWMNIFRAFLLGIKRVSKKKKARSANQHFWMQRRPWDRAITPAWGKFKKKKRIIKTSVRSNQ